MKTSRIHQRGLSLVELMIAMLLSLLLMAGVLQIFLSSKQTYSTNNALAQVQESGRFALDFIAYDVRNAAYKGECLTPINSLLNSSTFNGVRYNLDQGLQGWDSAQTTPSWFDSGDRISGTDMLLVNQAAVAAKSSPATGTVLTTGTSFALQGASGIASGAIVVTADPVGCDMFANTSSDSASNVSRAAGGAALSHLYTQDSSNSYSVLAYQSTLYYLALGSGDDPVLALFRRAYNTGTAVTEELVDGILDLQFEYGVDTGSDDQVDQYVAANDSSIASDWSNVLAVRISLIAMSRAKNVTSSAQSFDFAPLKGVTKENSYASIADGRVTMKDGRLAQVFTSTVGIRNRLP